MLWWEFGEVVTLCLNSIGLTEARWKRLAARYPILACNCLERRKWLNRAGERVYAWFNPLGHLELVVRFTNKVYWLAEEGPFSVAVVCDTVSYFCHVSENTCARWLDKLVDDGHLASLTVNGTVLYGLTHQQMTRCHKTAKMTV